MSTPITAPVITRANLPGAGGAQITWNSVTLFPRGDLNIPLTHDLQEMVSSLNGRVTKTRKGRMITLNIPIYGYWASLGSIMPGAVAGAIQNPLLAPVIGGRLFGTTDSPMIYAARNLDQITFANVQLTKLANLKLAANTQIFTGDATFTCLVANGSNPASANSFFTILEGGGTFPPIATPNTTFKSSTWIGVWGAESWTGGQFLTQDGWTLDWEIKTTPDEVDGIGPVDMFVDLVWAKLSCIPVVNDASALTKLAAATNFQGANAAVGANISADSGAMTLAPADGSGSSLIMSGAACTGGGFVFGASKKRTGTFSWETTLDNQSETAISNIIAVVA